MQKEGNWEILRSKNWGERQNLCRNNLFPAGLFYINKLILQGRYISPCYVKGILLCLMKMWNNEIIVIFIEENTTEIFNRKEKTDLNRKVMDKISMEIISNLFLHNYNSTSQRRKAIAEQVVRLKYFRTARSRLINSSSEKRKERSANFFKQSMDENWHSTMRTSDQHFGYYKCKVKLV